ncbi:phosphatase PAP2 family protein [Pseudonocardia sp. GCM10023141]|uniref:phosphatase PAP2 family protein n=1 Tax=Pseudonocardia sp. GCM10023141 TaxID=3252653 RepID=UPI00361A6A90
MIALLVDAVLGVRYAGESEGGSLDRHAETLLAAAVPSYSGRPADFVIQFGTPAMVILLAVVLAAICLATGNRPLAVLAVVGPGLAGLATTLLKPFIGRTIDGGFAYPSGHTGGATSIAIVVALLLLSRWQLPRAAALTVLFGTALVAGIGMAAALVSAEVHYPTDTIGGFCTSVVCVLGTALLIDAVTGRTQQNRSVSA